MTKTAKTRGRQSSTVRKAVRVREEAAKEMPMLENLPEGPPQRGGQSSGKPRRGESRDEGSAVNRRPAGGS